MHVRCPHCQNPIEVVQESSLREIPCPSCNSSFNLLGTDAETLDLDPDATLQRPDGLPPPSQVGHRSIAHFRLTHKLGSGAFGTVWRAEDTHLDRAVAIKIPRDSNLTPDRAEQFLREARAAAQLRHPRIVSVHEVGRHDGQVYIVSDLVEGRTLADQLTESPLSTEEAVRLCVEIADALQHAHEQGVIHRDLKPSNIMLDDAGHPFVMDFGLAKREAGEITMTVEGQLLGTPAYMSPEQARGSGRDADRRSDIYSLGVILFELLTGERPFRGNIRTLLRQVIEDEAPSPRKLNGNVPRDLETICLRCLEKDPARRFESVEAFADELRRFARGEPIHSRPISSPARGWRWCKRNPFVATSLALTFLALACGGGLATWQWIRAELARESEHRQKLDLERELRQQMAFRLTAQARSLREDFPERSVLLALEAVDVTRAYNEPIHPRVEQTLRDVLEWIGGTALDGPGGLAYGVLLTPDGEKFLTTNLDGKMRMWDLAGPLSSAVEFAGSESPVRPGTSAISPDGRWLAAACKDGSKWLWDLTANDPAASPRLLGTNAEAGVHVLVFSPDSRRLAAGLDDGSTQVWDLAAGDLAVPDRDLRGHEKRVHQILFTKDSRTLVTASWDDSICIWNLQAEPPRVEPIVLTGHEGQIHMALTPDNMRLITAGGDPTVRVWNLASSEIAETPRLLQGREAALPTVDHSDFGLSANGRWLAINDTGFVCVWDLEDATTDQPALVLQDVADEDHFAAAFMSIVLSADGERLVAGGQDGSIFIWNLTDENPSPVVIDGHDEMILDLALSTDNTQLVTTSWDESVRVWDLTAEDPGAASRSLRGHRQAVLQLTLSPNGKHLLTLGLDNRVRVWDLTSDTRGYARMLNRHRGQIADLALSADGRWLASSAEGAQENNAFLWDLETKDARTAPLPLTAYTNSTSARLAMSADGNRLVTAGPGNWTRIWDLSGRNPSPEPIELRHRQTLEGVDNNTQTAYGIFDMVLTSDGARLVTRSHSRDGDRIVSWNLAADDPQTTAQVLLEGPVDLFNSSLAISHDGSRLVAGRKSFEPYYQGGIRIWDLAAGEPLSPEVIESDDAYSEVGAWALSADGRWLATALKEDTPIGEWEDHFALTVWDLSLELTAPHAVLKGHTGRVRDLAWADDGTRLISGADDKTVRVWNLGAPTFHSSSVFDLHAAEVVRVVVSADGTKLLTISLDATMRVWDLEADDPPATAKTLDWEGIDITALAFSADGRRLVTGSSGGTIRVWPLRIEELIAAAHRVVGRQLTAEERITYGIQSTAGATQD